MSGFIVTRPASSTILTITNAQTLEHAYTIDLGMPCQPKVATNFVWSLYASRKYARHGVVDTLFDSLEYAHGHELFPPPRVLFAYEEDFWASRFARLAPGQVVMRLEWAAQISERCGVPHDKSRAHYASLINLVANRRRLLGFDVHQNDIDFMPVSPAMAEGLACAGISAGPGESHRLAIVYQRQERQIVCRYGNEAIAIASYDEFEGCSIFRDVTVEPALRGCGFGNAIYQSALNRLAMPLIPNPRANSAVQAIWARIAAQKPSDWCGQVDTVGRRYASVTAADFAATDLHLDIRRSASSTSRLSG